MSTPPSESSRSLTLAHPIRVVRSFLADFTHAPLWDPATLRSDLVGEDSAPGGDGSARVGSGWTTRSVLAGRTSTGHYRLDRGHPHWITLAGRHPGLTRTLEFALVDLGEHTEVHLTMRYAFHGLTAPARRGWKHRALAELTAYMAAGLPAALESHVSGRDTDFDGDLDGETGCDADLERHGATPRGRSTDAAVAMNAQSRHLVRHTGASLTCAPVHRVPPPIREAGLPSCVVDPWYQGWRLIPAGDATATSWMYSANLGHEPNRPHDPRTYRELAATRGPLRPVVPVSAADIHETDQILAEAANRAAPTIAAAIHAVYAMLCDTHSHLGATASQQLARQRLTAACEGTSHAAALLTLTPQLEPATPARIHPPTRDALTAMIIRWIFHPDHYIDPATTLTTILPSHLMPAGPTAKPTGSPPEPLPW